MATRNIYQQEVYHKGLNKYRVVKATTQYELSQKIDSQKSQWDEQWARITEREAKIKNEGDSLTYALEATLQAESTQNSLDRILTSALHPLPLDMNKLKNLAKFPEPRPQNPTLMKIPEKPQLSDPKYNRKPSFFTLLSKKKLAEFNENYLAEFNKDTNAWMTAKSVAEEIYNRETQKSKVLIEQWDARRNEYLRIQADVNKNIDSFFEKYKSGNTEEVERYFMLTLERVELPFSYEKTVEVEYDAERKILIVDLFLPVIDDIPKLKSVTYTKSKKEFKETYYSESYMKTKYDNVMYQIVLQVLNNIFTLSKPYFIIDSVVLNGKISTIDKATGKSIEPYILSVNIARNAFEEINLEAVDPKSWFKSSKGVSAATFANVIPIAPVVLMKREDKRFVEGYAVSDSLDEGINLAAIDWQDFENLIREIFEQEFNTNGGEVKITQASRDGGVDAVAFDPDPIRGGKIVIQAKRYTNVVGVSAVRDLYGTVMNEGATKGILVTTSNYGNDAYSFAQGKPITLMNGANLLYLLEKHGHKARIDLKEAKDILYK